MCSPCGVGQPAVTVKSLRPDINPSGLGWTPTRAAVGLILTLGDRRYQQVCCQNQRLQEQPRFLPHRDTYRQHALAVKHSKYVFVSLDFENIMTAFYVLFLPLSMFDENIDPLETNRH